MKLIQFNYFCMAFVMLNFFQVTNAMEADPHMVPMDDAMRHYEEDGLLDPDRTKFSELKKVINENKKTIASCSMLSFLLTGFSFNQFLIPQIGDDKNMSIFKWIKEHPKTSTIVAATSGGVVGGVSATMSHIAHREQKRAQLDLIKTLERNREQIINDPHVDDVVRGIQLNHNQLLLDQAILKFNQK